MISFTRVLTAGCLSTILFSSCGKTKISNKTKVPNSETVKILPIPLINKSTGIC